MVSSSSLFLIVQSTTQELSKEKVLICLDWNTLDCTFELKSTEDKGTDLKLTALTPNDKIKSEMTAGWVSVLMAMKGAIDFGIDLRNQHEDRVWDRGYLDN